MHIWRLEELHIITKEGSVCLARRFPRDDFSEMPDRPDLPPLRNLAEGGSDARVVFVAREAEVDEPLAVEGAGHRFQNLDTPLAVLDEFVVGRQDARDALLDGERGIRKSKVSNLSRLRLS